MVLPQFFVFSQQKLILYQQSGLAQIYEIHKYAEEPTLHFSRHQSNDGSEIIVSLFILLHLIHGMPEVTGQEYRREGTGQYTN